jgi:hypothetical protein
MSGGVGTKQGLARTLTVHSSRLSQKSPRGMTCLSTICPCCMCMYPKRPLSLLRTLISMA